LGNIGFIFAMKGRIPTTSPGMPATAGVGVILGASGFALRLWSLLMLRERFTRILLVQPGHQIERSGLPIYTTSWLLGIAALPE
jgi:hypothetical protein